MPRSSLFLSTWAWRCHPGMISRSSPIFRPSKMSPVCSKALSALRQLLQRRSRPVFPPDRIIIGGFSQGCAVSLATSAVFDKPLAGVIGLSGYLPIRDTIVSYAVDNKLDVINKKTPYFLGHGTADPVVQFQYGKLSRDVLINQLGRENVSWNEYPGMEHSSLPRGIGCTLKVCRKGSAWKDHNCLER